MKAFLPLYPSAYRLPLKVTFHLVVCLPYLLLDCFLIQRPSRVLIWAEEVEEMIGSLEDRVSFNINKLN